MVLKIKGTESEEDVIEFASGGGCVDVKINGELIICFKHHGDILIKDKIGGLNKIGTWKK